MKTGSGRRARSSRRGFVARVPEGWAERYLLRIEVDGEGKITAFHSVLATAKLQRMPIEGG